MTSHRTHRVRLARAAAALAGIGYQAALSEVIDCADAGLLPARLDGPGMREAVDVVLAHLRATGTTTAETGVGAAELAPRYYRLVEVCTRLQPGVTARLARAATLGMPPVRHRGDMDPVELLTNVYGDEQGESDPDAGTGWWQRMAKAGRRPDCALPDLYPSGSTPDGSVPIDHALDRREATGDVDGYERELHRIVRTEPRDIDAHAHLGHLYLSLADPGGDLVVTPPPDQRQRQAWLRTALGHYQCGIAVAELALPDPFAGLLVWGELDNRPFLRATHGLALALWRLRRFQSAELALLNMLWLNPMDNQGASVLLPAVQAGRCWEDAADE
jgi:hypothetical protein